MLVIPADKGAACICARVDENKIPIPVSVSIAPDKTIAKSCQRKIKYATCLHIIAPPEEFPGTNISVQEFDVCFEVNLLKPGSDNPNLR